MSRIRNISLADNFEPITDTMSTNLAGRIDLNLLRVFLAIYDAKSVGGAALALEMSQPGLSTALARLRKQLGDPLFLRSAAGMEPTSRARELAESVRAIMRTIHDEVLKAPLFDPATSRREFRIALTDIAEGIYLPTVLMAAQAGGTHITVRSVFMSPRQLEAEMGAGTVDIAVGYYPDIKGSAFMHRRIGLHSFACIASTRLSRVGDQLTMTQFSTLPHVAVEATGRSQELFDRFLLKRKLSRNVLLRSPHFMSVPYIVAQTNTLAVVPQGLADFVAGHPHIKQVALPFTPPVFQSNLYWHRSAHADPANQWLRQALIQNFPVLQSRRYERNARTTSAV